MAATARQLHLTSPLPDGFRIQVLVFLSILPKVAAGEVLRDQVDAVVVCILPAPVTPDDVGVLLRVHNERSLLMHCLKQLPGFSLAILLRPETGY